MNSSVCRSILFFSVSLAVVTLGYIQPLRAANTFGPIHLEVDATHAPQKILHVRMQMPVQPGPLVLYYPEWIPGEHMPDGPIMNVAGMFFKADGKILPWRRDLIDTFEFHLNIPAGVHTLDVSMDFLLSAPNSGFSSGASATAALDVMSWNQVLLYPAGFSSREITFVPSLEIPQGWQFGTALPVSKRDGNTIDFSRVPLNTLVDSPVLAGRYFRRIELTPGQKPIHEMDIVSDNPADLDMTPETEKDFRNLVAQTGPLFGNVRHYRDYHFLLTLSNQVAHFGLEHHESSDDRSYARSLTDPNTLILFSDLIPHEFTHSWNGKFRRPADLATPDFQTPMKDDLLWVYEGLTEYYGEVLTARAGFWSPQLAREALADVAGQAANRPGRVWRPLQDTADFASVLYDAGADWSNWRRGTDFYQEGELLWLDVDSTIRRLTNDQKSMNDFCRIFYGGPGGKPALKTYTFDDIVSTLNTVAPYDWAGFLRKRLDSLSPDTPTESVANSGWKLVYTDQPNEYQQAIAAVRHRLDATLSIGLLLGDNGNVIDVIHGSPAYDAGIGPGMKITAVDRRAFTPETLTAAITAAKSSSAPIELMVANGPQFQTDSINYHGGLRYAHLEREAGKPDYLTQIFSPMPL
ncbi:MAG: M61 family metallopeptidase [Candidatus Acidiferrales bacterium]